MFQKTNEIGKEVEKMQRAGANVPPEDQAVSFLRTIQTTIKEIEWPVKLAASCFFSVVFIGSVICWLSGMADTLPRSLFRTLNIMVTSADLREQDYPAPWQHVFISLLKQAKRVQVCWYPECWTSRMKLRPQSWVAAPWKRRLLNGIRTSTS